MQDPVKSHFARSNVGDPVVVSKRGDVDIVFFDHGKDGLKALNVGVRSEEIGCLICTVLPCRAMTPKLNLDQSDGYKIVAVCMPVNPHARLKSALLQKLNYIYLWTACEGTHGEREHYAKIAGKHHSPKSEEPEAS